MPSATPSSETPEVPTFQPLGNYTAPSPPTTDALQRLLGRFRHAFAGSTQPFIAEDRLQRSTRDMLDEVAAPPACGPLLEELQVTLADWVADAVPVRRLKLIVLPPGDEHGVVEAWAREHGHTLLPPPEREKLIDAQPRKLPDLDGEGVLVVAQLERWFLRHRNGLNLIRALLAHLDTLDRHCVIGCNSWAWAFLCKAVGADLILPDAMTFQAFDARRLRLWFSALAAGKTLDGLHFRLSRSGEDLMASNDEGELTHDYFKTLAARSKGIPWVAWHLWRGSLRSDMDPAEASEDANAAAATDAQTLWVTALDEFSLPGEPSETALLVLQALLIHGTLSVDELRLVLPLVGQSNIVSTLLAAGIVQRDGARISCTPAAYPSIRSGLSTAGLPKDRL